MIRNVYHVSIRHSNRKCKAKGRGCEISSLLSGGLKKRSHNLVMGEEDHIIQLA